MVLDKWPGFAWNPEEDEDDPYGGGGEAAGVGEEEGLEIADEALRVLESGIEEVRASYGPEAGRAAAVEACTRVQKGIYEIMKGER